MGTLLALLGLGGLLFGLVNLVRPMGRLGISTRRRAGSLSGASLGVFILGAATILAVIPEPDLGADLSPTTIAAMVAEAPTTTHGVDLEPASDPPRSGVTGDPGSSLPEAVEPAVVDAITDGDTIEVVLGEGNKETIRLIGVDAPEHGECWAAEAVAVLETLIPAGSEIAMTSDQSDRDRFDRLLRYLWVGSMSVNEELVRRGAAISRRYPPDTAMATRLDAAQDAARSAAEGLWAQNACGDATDADLRIVELRYDAEGDDNQNLNDEWIRIRNDGDSHVDLTHWGIKDESATNRYTFPPGFSLAPKEVVTIYSGCGDDFDTALYWCSVGSAIWNNDGDTAFLLDPSGNTHYYWSYSG